MQITQTKSDALNREFIVKMTPQEIDGKVNDKLQELGKTVNMPGFRPGKAPMALLKSKYGKAVMGEVLEAAVNESTLQAINENNLRPAMRPKIEVKHFDEKEGLEYTMAIEILPEVKVMDITTLKLEKLAAEPQEKEVKEALQRVAKSNRTTKKIEDKRAAKLGDVLMIDFDGAVNGEALPGMKGEGHMLELGSKSFVDTFEEQLVGAKAGDKKTITVTFPADYGHDKLKGQKAEFKVEVKEIHEEVLPEFNDEFAKKFDFENLAKLEEFLKKTIQNEYDELSRMNLKRALLDVLDENHEFDLPAGMVEAEFQGIWQQLKGHNHEDPNHVHGPDCNHDHGTEEEREEFHGIAERRVKLGLVLAEIGRANKIDVTPQELQSAVIAECRRYPGKEKQVFEYFQNNPQALDAVKAPIYEDKVIDFVLERSKIDTRQVSIEELTKASEQEPAKKAKPTSKSKSSAKKAETTAEEADEKKESKKAVKK